jgi:hypothetical protein
MQPRREHPVIRIVEELEPGMRMSALSRRLLGFKRAGILEYWSVDPENKQIFPYRLNGFSTQDKLPADWKEMVADFFASSSGSAAPDWPEDVAAIYEEINEEDRRLAESFFPTVQETWPTEPQQ